MICSIICSTYWDDYIVLWVTSESSLVAMATIFNTILLHLLYGSFVKTASSFLLLSIIQWSLKGLSPFHTKHNSLKSAAKTWDIQVNLKNTFNMDMQLQLKLYRYHRPPLDRLETAPLMAQRPQVSCARCRSATATTPIRESATRSQQLDWHNCIRHWIYCLYGPHVA